MSIHRPHGIYEKFVKRFIDIFASLLVLVSFCWLYAVLAILVKYNLGAPVIFTQERPGKIDPHTKKTCIFKLYKFRSMADKYDENGDLLPDNMRLTKFGRLLRSTSLDELPELFNILKGDMSLVGPRPLLVKYLDYYDSFDMRRHEVRPGLTGLSQVSGRNALTWKMRFEYDVEYVDNVSFWLDFKIVLLTIKKVFIREGIEYKDKGTILDYFEGKRKKSEL